MRGVITSVEARTAIALFLRREARYKEAIQVMRGLKNEYPHDFLFCLEEANLRKDDGEGMVAVEAYREILADNAKPGYFYSARLELAYFGLGDALRGQRHYGEAAQAYEQAALDPECGAGAQDPVAAGRGRVPRSERRAPAGSEGLPGRHRCRPQYLPRRYGEKASAQSLYRELTRQVGLAGALRNGTATASSPYLEDGWG